MQVFLDAIYENYIIFILVSVFLILALIGYFVDKKTRKDSDIKPFFSMVGKKDKNAPKKEKNKKEKKKGKNEYKSVIIGGENPPAATTGITQAVEAASQSTPVNSTSSTISNQVSSTVSPAITSTAPAPSGIALGVQGTTPNPGVTPYAQQPISDALSSGAVPNAASQNITSNDEAPMNLNMSE